MNTLTENLGAATAVDHTLLPESAARLASPSTGFPAFHLIPWPAGAAPQVLPDETGPTLPNCDALLMTFAEDAADAMAALLTPGYAVEAAPEGTAPRWQAYVNDFQSYIPDLVPGPSPALDACALGFCKLIRIGQKRVLCFKSNLGLAHDRSPVPLTRLIQQMIAETGASLVITTGTTAGFGPDAHPGDAVIATGSTAVNAFALKDSTFLNLVNPTLIQVNSGFLGQFERAPRVEWVGAGGAFSMEPDDLAVTAAVDAIGAAAPQWISIRGMATVESGAAGSENRFYAAFSSILASWAAVLSG